MTWYELQLPVYKQGDDLAACIRECDGDHVRALKMQAARYWKADEMLKEVALHPRAHELTFTADTHSIVVEGPEAVLEELLERSLLICHMSNEEAADG